MRHLVLEGPDGGGKTILAEALLAEFPQLVRAERAATSLKGPIKNLAAWVRDQYIVMDNSIVPRLYDRHPVISEPIYGPIIRGYAEPGFTHSPWLSSARIAMFTRTYVIWCIPPLEQVKKAVSEDRDMPGVASNIEALHQRYLHEMKQWEGPGIRYDFTHRNFGMTDDALFQSTLEWVEEHAPLLYEKVFRV